MSHHSLFLMEKITYLFIKWFALELRFAKFVKQQHAVFTR